MAVQVKDSLIDATPPQSGFVKRSQLPELAARQKDLNRVRPGFIPNGIKEQSRRTQVYIFNVGPKRQEGNGASYGPVMIPACPEGREYSEPYIVPGLPHEGYRTSGNRMDIQFHGEDEAGNGMEDPGFDWACQAILGFTQPNGEWNGKFLPQGRSLERFGVGISRTWPPSKEDIELAKSKMRKEDLMSVQSAREAHANGRMASLANSDECFAAARRLGLSASTERWMELSYSAPQKQTKFCPECAEEIMAAAKKCRHCGSKIEA